MRVDPEQQDFSEYLLKLGNGEMNLNAMGEIELLTDIILDGNLIDKVFGNCLATGNYEEMKDRGILAPLKKDASEINAF